MISIETLFRGPRYVYPLALHQKWVLYVTLVFFICIRIDHKNMTNQKIGQVLRRVGTVILKLAKERGGRENALGRKTTKK